MKVGIHLKSVFTGSLIILSILAAALLLRWMLSYPMSSDGHFNGQQFLLICFIPPAAIASLYYIAIAIHQIWAGFTRYALDANGVTISSPLRTQFIRWSSTKDFFLPPAPFPTPPQTLLLVADGRKLKLPLDRLRKVHADELLSESIPALRAWGLERARAGEAQTLSPLRTRWHLYKSDLFAVYACIFFFLLWTLGSLGMAWEFVDYLRILQSHESARGQITQIIEESGKERTIEARVTYTIPGGRVFRLRREVRVDFFDRFKVGDHVTVDYLPNHPSIGRIRDWDMDGRQWILLLFAVIAIPLTYTATKRALAKWFCPLREPLAWCASSADPPIAISGVDLPLLYSILPDRHEGTIVAKPPAIGSDKFLGFKSWKTGLRKNGIEATAERGKFIVFSPPQAARMLQRLGGTKPPRTSYIVLSTQAPTDADFSLLDGIVMPFLLVFADAPPEHVKLYCMDQIVGPTDESQRRQIFQRWLTLRLNRLYGGAMPSEIPQPDFATLLNFDPASASCEILIERRRSGPRVWIRHLNAPRACLAECRHGRWTTNENLPAPKLLKSPATKQLTRRMEKCFHFTEKVRSQVAK